MEKIKDFFKRIFKRNHLIQITEGKENLKKQGKKLRNELKVNEDKELLYFQKKFENGEINELTLSNRKVKELITLYENQIKELNYKIALKNCK